MRALVWVCPEWRGVGGVHMCVHVCARVDGLVAVRGIAGMVFACGM